MLKLLKKKNNWRSKKKQVHALKTLKPKELKATEDKSDDDETYLKYKEVFNELSNEKLGEIYNISKEIDFNLIYHLKVLNLAPVNFINFRGPMHTYNERKSGNVSVDKNWRSQKNLNQN